MSDVSRPRPPAEDPSGPVGPPAPAGPLFNDPVFGESGPAFGEAGPVFGGPGPIGNDAGALTDGQRGAGPDDAAFIDGPAMEPACADPAFMDPAFLDPAFMDPAFLDPAFLDSAFPEPAFPNPALVDAAFTDDYDIWDLSGDAGDDLHGDDPDAVTIAALLDHPLTSAAELADAIAWCYDDAALPLLLPVAGHDDARVRRAVAQALPSVLGDADPAETIRVLIQLSVDRDEDVRDWACFALGTQLSEVDSPQVRDALLARLADPHDDTRCEALLGLARRRDTRVVPVLREWLARDNAFSLEIDAAGAIGDPSLHTLVRGHLSGWDDDVVTRVCAALRLTDPDGVGGDLLDGLAEWFRDGAPHANDEDRYWWSVTLQVLEHAEYRAPEIAESVRERLAGNPTATVLMLGSRLAQLAGDHGWPHWSD